MNTKTVLFYGLTILLGGCIPVVSLHPLFTQDSLVFEDKLLGTWTGEVTWEFARLDVDENAEMLPDELRDRAGKVYRLDITDDEGRQGSFVACLVKVGDKRFLDVFPDRFPSGEADPEKMKLLYNAFFFLRVHTFVRIDSVGEQLVLRLTDDEQFGKLIEAEPKAVEHEMIEDRPVLTAPTEQLRAFVAKYADDERLFPNEVTLTRKED